MHVSDSHYPSRSPNTLHVAHSKAWHWTVGICVTLSLGASIAVTRYAASRIAPTDEIQCRTRALNDAHASMEAFFQNPSGQDALQQAIAACRK
jgi:hypothetical protein